MKCRNVVVSSVAPSIVASLPRQKVGRFFTIKLVVLAFVQLFVPANVWAGKVTGPPVAPTNLVAVGVTTNKIKLTWQDKSSNESGFKIDRALAPTGPWSINVATVKANVTTYTNSGLASGKTFYYRIRSYNGKGYSAYTAIVSASTLLPGGACTFAISPTNASVASQGGTGTVAVTAGTNCPWTAVSGAGWLTISSGASGIGGGSVNYSVAANSSTNARSAAMTIAGKTFMVTQAGVPVCSFACSPSSASFPGEGGNGEVTLTTGAGCNWSASASESWISLTSSANGAGSATVSYSVAANPGSASRSATLVIGGQSVLVEQAAGSLSIGQAVDNVSVNWNVGGNAGWFAQTNVSLTAGSAAQSGAIGNGQSSVITFLANGPMTLSFFWKVSSEIGWDSLRLIVDDVELATLSGEVDWQERTFSLAEGLHEFTWIYSKDPSCCIGGSDAAWIDQVRLSSATCVYALNPPGGSFDANGGSGTMTLTTGGGCPWTASTPDGWIHTTASGSSSGTVSYTVDANPVSIPRWGSITVAGQTFTVFQSGVPCSYAIAPSGWTHSANAEFASFNVTNNTGCSWLASSASPWIHTTSSGTGTGAVDYTVDANPGTGSRSGSISVGDQTFAVVQSGISCTYGVSPGSANAAAGGGSGSFSVNTPAGCAWTASAISSWLHTSTSGNTSGTVNYTVDANDSINARSGSISVGGQNFTVNQAGVTCSYGLNPASFNHGSSAGSGSFTVNAPAGCGWSAITAAGWIHTTSTGNGGGTANYTIDANTSASSRSATIAVGGQSFTVNQSGVSCSYALNPTGANPGAGASGGSFTVTAPSGCAWSASTAATWIHTTSSSNGNGTVTYTVDANGSTSGRSGTILVGGQSFTVNQAGISCSYALTPTSFNHGSGAASGSFSVTAPTGCAWSAGTAAGWIHTGSSSNGNGTVSYTVDANSSTSSRSGTINVAGQSFTVNQSGISCSYTLSANGASFGSAGGSSNVVVTAAGACSWSASSGAAWLTINGSTNGTGPGTIVYSVGANAGTAQRSAALTIAGQTYTVTQNGNQAPIANAGFDISVTLGGNANFSAAGSYDPDGSLNSYQWNFGDGTTGSGLTISHLYSGIGVYTVRLTVTDNLGLTSSDTAFATVVAPADTTPPSVVLNVSGSPYVAGIATLSATALDNLGVTKVEFYYDTTLATTLTVPPYSVNLDTRALSSGSHSFIAKAYDAAGNNNSSTVPVVVDNMSPTTSLTSPANGSSVSSVITLSASASDNSSGSGIARVEFYCASQTAPIGTATSAPYQVTCDTTTMPNGTHNFYCKAYDTVGNSALSTANSVTINNTVSTPTGQALLERCFGGIGSGAGAITKASVVDRAGNLIIVGAMYYTVDFGKGPISSAGGQDAFVAKYSSSGQCLWSKCFGNVSSDVAYGVALDSADNIFVTGSFSGPSYGGTLDFGTGPQDCKGGSDIFLLKLAGNGTHLWTKLFGGSGSDVGIGVATDSSDNIVLTATDAFFGTGANFGAGAVPTYGQQDVVVAKLNSSGGYIWARSFGGSDSDLVTGIALDSGGNVVVVGQFRGSANFGNGSVSSAGDTDAYVAKYSGADGSYQWFKRFGDSRSQTVSGITIDSSGNVIVAGDFTGTIDFNGALATAEMGGSFYVAKYSASGLLSWAKSFGAPDNGPHAAGVAVDNTGRIVVTGEMTTGIDFGTGWLLGMGGNDTMVVKLGSTGAVVWAKRGAPYGNRGSAITIDKSNGNIFVSGDCGTSGVDFSALSVVSTSGTANNSFFFQFAP